MIYRSFLTAALFCLLAASPAAAMPGGDGGKFGAADANKDGALSQEEFQAAFPALKPEAFTRIDADADGRITAEEWRRFSSGHSAGHEAGTGHAAPPETPAPDAGSSAPGQSLPLLAPPAR